MKTISDYTIFCTEAQTKKALELGAPLQRYTSIPNFADVIEITTSEYYEIPTAEQMIGFLRGKGIKFHFDDGTSYWRVNNNSKLISYGWSEQKELVAIDAALEYLEKQKEID